MNKQTEKFEVFFVNILVYYCTALIGGQADKLVQLVPTPSYIQLLLLTSIICKLNILDFVLQFKF